MVRDNLFRSADGYVEKNIGDLADDSQAAAWLIHDVQFDLDFLVEIVDAITSGADVREGCGQEFAGNAWHVVVDSGGISLLNMYIDRIGTRLLSRKDVLSVISQYWQCVIDLKGAEPFVSSVDAFTTAHGRPPMLPWPLDRPLAAD